MSQTQPQIVTIANAFELVCPDIVPYSAMTVYGKIDERHFADKAAFWCTQYGRPDVVLSVSAPSEVVLSHTYGQNQRPIFISPQRTTSSICLDILRDLAAWRQLTSLLDRTRPVFLAPYIHTQQVDALASSLSAAGFRLVDYRAQGLLVRDLCSKVYVERHIFATESELIHSRPLTSIAAGLADLRTAASLLAQDGAEELVIKSAAAVGGAGVFFANSAELANGKSSLEAVMSGAGQNEVTRSAPFLLEERVKWDVTPTVDIVIAPNGDIRIVSVALQRLFDNRYYTGFYWGLALEKQWWAERTRQLATLVGHCLFKAGYYGCANIDFVVSEKQRKITLIEVNPRRSALLDAYSISQMTNSDNAQLTSISTADCVIASKRFQSIEEIERSLDHSVIAVADSGLLSHFRWVGLLATASTGVHSETALQMAVSRLQDTQQDELGSLVGRDGAIEAWIDRSANGGIRSLQRAGGARVGS